MTTTPGPPPAHKFTLQVLSTSSCDSGPSLLLTFAHNRYLFNTPESISRICVQTKTPMRRIKQIFLGSLKDSAGLPGTILTTFEGGNRELEVFGPNGTDHFVASCRHFTRRDELSFKVTTPPPLVTASTLPPPIHTDANLSVHAFPILPPSSHSPSLKRKRSASPTSSPPRSKSPPLPATTDYTSTSTEPTTSTSTLSNPPPFNHRDSSFNPTSLRGLAATQWKNIVLADMFKGTKFLSSPPPPQPKRQPGQPQSPSHLPAQLPPPEIPVVGETAVSYLVQTPKTRGRFLPEKAKEFGVPPQKISLLTKGERIWVGKIEEVKDEELGLKGGENKKTIEKLRRAAMKKREDAVVEGEGEGRWVEPAEVMEESVDGLGILVLNLPTLSHLETLSSLSYTTLFNPTSTPLTQIFYFLGPDIPLNSSQIATFASSFPPTVHHQFAPSNSQTSHNPVTFTPAAFLSLRLSQLAPSIFRLPHYTKSPPTLPDTLPSNSSILNTNSFFLPDGTPHTPTGFSANPPFEPSSSLDSGNLVASGAKEELKLKASEAWKEYVAQAAAVREELKVEVAKRIVSDGEEAWKGVKVTALGTGSAIPSKYRNVSGTLLHIPEGGEEKFLLLDCGEGTWGQIARTFGGEEGGSERVLRALKVVFVSHMHQDHHAGIVTVLRERAKLDPLPKDPLIIVAPPSARTYIWEQQTLFDLGVSPSRRGKAGEVNFIDNWVLERGKKFDKDDNRLRGVKDVEETLGVKITTVPVLHRCRCWGAVIDHKSGWRAVFSGDTMPCDALVDAGKDATLLIHEATIQDDMPEVAEAKGHSTFGQAIDVARRMSAKHLLLTHFSARYPKLPPLNHVEGENVNEPIVAMAFDMMTLGLDEFWKAERFRKPMDTLMGWDEVEEQESTSVIDAAPSGEGAK
ncbi:3' tRNA processing endoribonuclease [Pseudohyphozyma bogoriensis]|nr:3' tRNA processing endoribonuclease [Pseudohyphozyma bogoriensis]